MLASTWYLREISSHIAVPSIPDNLTGQLGRIITHFSVADFLVREMTQLLLAYQNKSVLGWRTQETTKRFRLHMDQFKAVFIDSEDILVWHKKMIVDQFWYVKLVRDKIAHRQIMSIKHNGENSIVFADKDGAFRSRRKPYTSDTLDLILDQTNRVAGAVDQIASNPETLPLSSQSISVLQHVLGEDRWNAATSRALGHQP